MLMRLSRASFHHRRLVVASWAGRRVVAAFAVGPALAGNYANSGRLPAHRLAGRVRPPRPRLPAASRRRSPDRLRRHPRTTGRRSTRTSRRSRNAPGVLVASSRRWCRRAGTIAVVPITTANGDSDHPTDIAHTIEDLAAPLRAQGVDVQFSGGWFTDSSMPASEIVGIVAAIVVLLVAFGSLIAMGLPILTALVGIGISLAGVGDDRPRTDDAELRAAGRGDDRHRRGDRLRAVHRHPLPRRAAPYAVARDGDARGDEHVGSRRRVRGHDSDDLGARHVLDAA